MKIRISTKEFIEKSGKGIKTGSPDIYIAFALEMIRIIGYFFTAVKVPKYLDIAPRGEAEKRYLYFFRWKTPLQAEAGYFNDAEGAIFVQSGATEAQAKKRLKSAIEGLKELNPVPAILLLFLLPLSAPAQSVTEFTCFYEAPFLGTDTIKTMETEVKVCFWFEACKIAAIHQIPRGINIKRYAAQLGRAICPEEPEPKYKIL